MNFFLGGGGLNQTLQLPAIQVNGCMKDIFAKRKNKNVTGVASIVTHSIDAIVLHFCT